MIPHTIGGLNPAALGVRRAIEDEIERLIAMLDATDPDPDIEENGDERDASYPERGNAFDPLTRAHPHEDDEDGHDLEAEDEHGGDIQDEPHDREEPEPFLGWGETCGQVGFHDLTADDGWEDGGIGRFDGRGSCQAAALLRTAPPRKMRSPDPIGERTIRLPRGGGMCVLVSPWTGCVVRA